MSPTSTGRQHACSRYMINRIPEIHYFLDSPTTFDDVELEFQKRNITNPIIIWTDFERFDLTKFR